MDIDEDMRQVEEVHNGRDESGSTGVCGLVTPTEIVIANCGDSRLVLVRDGKVGFATEDHKPGNVRILLRIHACVILR
jgi:protein phosphatase 1B